MITLTTSIVQMRQETSLKKINVGVEKGYFIVNKKQKSLIMKIDRTNNKGMLQRGGKKSAAVIGI